MNPIISTVSSVIIWTLDFSIWMLPPVMMQEGMTRLPLARSKHDDVRQVYPSARDVSACAFVPGCALRKGALL